MNYLILQVRVKPRFDRNAVAPGRGKKDLTRKPAEFFSYKIATSDDSTFIDKTRASIMHHQVECFEYEEKLFTKGSGHLVLELRESMV